MSESTDAFAAFERAGWDSGRASPYHRGLGAMVAPRAGGDQAADAGFRSHGFGRIRKG